MLTCRKALTVLLLLLMAVITARAFVSVSGGLLLRNGEPQGLYSVFATDTTTLRLIQSAAFMTNNR